MQQMPAHQQALAVVFYQYHLSRFVSAVRKTNLMESGVDALLQHSSQLFEMTISLAYFHSSTKDENVGLILAVLLIAA